jgi:alpha-L-fucosidase
MLLAPPWGQQDYACALNDPLHHFLEFRDVKKRATDMHKRLLLTLAIATLPTFSRAADLPAFPSPVSANTEPMATGKFEPTWDSLKQYEVPEWFKNAKFGLWAHWGPQCEPEDGDWYARNMYIKGSPQNKFHVAHYGPPSKFGFKDVIHEWHAENWDPEALMDLYKRAGAQYFVALANHHDNFDNFDSKYQPWNSVNMGPKKDLIGGWAKAARDHGMRFGVSIHAAHAWSWYEVAQGADKTGEFAGVPYDGKMTKADGKGLWWDGFDPQDLYAQSHVPGAKLEWDWNAAKGSSIPDVAYCDKFYNRTIDLINKYSPDLVYFDDTALPLYPVSDAGLKIAAHFYNSNMKLHDGKLEAVLTNKVLTPEQKQCMVWDIERGQSSKIEPFVWQTDTCIGGWHYDRKLYENHKYKSTATVLQNLSDIVSKNGNLLLSIPVRADGTIDPDEHGIVEGIADWMDVNKEAIFSSRPWVVFGEGPSLTAAKAMRAQGFNEGTKFTAADVRFTTQGKILYAIVMNTPTSQVTIKSLGKTANRLGSPIATVELLGQKEKLTWSENDDALTIDPPVMAASPLPVVFKITASN